MKPEHRNNEETGEFLNQPETRRFEFEVIPQGLMNGLRERAAIESHQLIAPFQFGRHPNPSHSFRVGVGKMKMKNFHNRGNLFLKPPARKTETRRGFWIPAYRLPATKKVGHDLAAIEKRIGAALKARRRSVSSRLLKPALYTDNKTGPLQTGAGQLKMTSSVHRLMDDPALKKSLRLSFFLIAQARSP